MRIRPSLKAKAFKESPLLAILLPATRTIPHARQELRWIREEVDNNFVDQAATSNKKTLRFQNRQIDLLRRCMLRGRKGWPLQYVLGNQPFGDSLNILCKPGVLIPRWETEEWGVKLASIVKANHEFFSDKKYSFRVLDLCTGTGCLGLLLAEQLENTQVVGMDDSPVAVSLARKNETENRLILDTRNSSFTVSKQDIFAPFNFDGLFDLVVANPPYISIQNYNDGLITSPSVRKFEPRHALVGGLEYYVRIFEIADQVNANAVVCELADKLQLDEIQSVLQNGKWNTKEMLDSAGNIRTIIAWRDQWAWMKNLA
ncbi:S-adenosyl-L-methionine-dependent methyltransferase [Lipomyces japonicus]|uniref:S-adenosyl-L-methionine-dependent methyltransferase n=1 Tax=Lipomyces japonicus TaxID=56871 RepID=UPI0034CE8742